jgi:hypothetical protein
LLTLGFLLLLSANVRRKKRIRTKNMKTFRSSSSAVCPSPASLSTGLTGKDSRMRIYSCEFCEFIQLGFAQVEGKEEEAREDEETGLDPAYEAKYLYHLKTVHGLEK